MKVLLAYEWCGVGGVETFMLYLAKGLRAHGHQCELFFFTHGLLEPHLPPDCVAHFGDLADCIKLVKSRGFDIVHANSSDLRIGISAVRTVGAKLVITCHGMVVPGWDSTNCDALTTCSRWQAEDQQVLTDLPVETVIYGIDMDKFKPADNVTPTGPPIIAWVGRGVDMVHKRIDKLAAIAPILHRAGLRIRIADPYGPKEVEKVVPDAARALLPVTDFWGMIPRENLPDFYREVAASGGCIISTSISEGFSLVLAEAQACGCPAIGTNVRGVNEVIRPEHGGVLYPFEMEPQQLANLVLTTLGDNEQMSWRRETCAQAARERFSVERMVRDYMRIYDETLSREHRSSALMRARVWLEPLFNWKNYVERRWTAGLCHYEASRKLAEQREWDLASSAAWLSLFTCPTLYARPGRLAHLLKILLRPNSLLDGRQAMK